MSFVSSKGNILCRLVKIELYKIFAIINRAIKGLHCILYQSKCLGSVKGGKDARSHRWSKEILSFAISLYITSPRTYRLLTSVLFLPSESRIKKYKNNLEKDPGINHDYIQWMCKGAERTESPKIGGLIFDEMSIQSGLQLQPHGEGLSMLGFVDFGEENSGTHTMFHQGKPLEVATSVLQFIFLSLNGFRFPFTYMFCEGVSTGESHTIIMDIFQTLASYEFKIKNIYVWMGQPSTGLYAIPSRLAHLQ